MVGRLNWPDQHLQMAIMRAIEFEKPMIRSTNNGISTIINENGKVIKLRIETQLK